MNAVLLQEHDQSQGGISSSTLIIFLQQNFLLCIITYFFDFSGKVFTLE